MSHAVGERVWKILPARVSEYPNSNVKFGGARELENEREITQYFKAAVAAAEEEHVLAVVLLVLQESIFQRIEDFSS